MWKAWSSRLVTATLALGSGHLHIMSCYAPTYAASRSEKDEFFDNLQQALSDIPSRDKYVMLGDFNARVGSRQDGDEWWNVRGPHGFGETNEAGKELLAFLSMNEATVCNTWYEKKKIYKATWQHPRTKQWHCIDYAIVKQGQRKWCKDVAVVRGAECNTDHHMLRMKLDVRMKTGSHKSQQKESSKGRYDVAKLQGASVDENGEITTRGKYQQSVGERVKEAWDTEGSVEEKWEVMKAALCESAQLLLGKTKRKDPDWFQENLQVLKPFLKERNRVYATWLGSKKESDWRKFLKLRREARRAIREAKNEWFLQKAAEAQRGRHGGKVVWSCIRDMQRGRRGLVPVKLAAVKDEEGNPCRTSEEQQQRWRRHFHKILNIQSHFDETLLETAKQRPVRQQMDDPPSREELERAVRKLKRGKAGGSSGILPEMVRVASCDDQFLDALMDLVGVVWEKKCVPKDWANAVLVPIPKKGDLNICDNWRGIALLDVVGKVVARVVQERLQELAEDELSEAQCGFRKGRSCMDMIFTLRQLVEKSWEHEAKLFVTFVDLKKAYDSVPRAALWIALKKLGVPDNTIQLIRSFHQGMKARISLDGKLSEEFDVENGLRQGCCMAPVLFNLYSGLMMECWHERVRHTEGVGVSLKYKMDGKLFRRYTRNAMERELTTCMFADDSALLASTKEGSEKAVQVFNSTSSDFGLTMSIPKTKHMVTGRAVLDQDKGLIEVSGGEVEATEEFPYLGSIISADGRVDTEVEKRISQASRAFGALRKAVFMDRNLRLETKRRIYQACVLSVLLYGSESWVLLRKHSRKLDSFHHRCIRTILGISNRQQWTQHITSYGIRRRWGDLDTATQKITKRRLEWLGHVARMPDYRIPKATLFGWLAHPRPRGGPRKRWRDVIRKDLKEMDVSEEGWYREAVSSRGGWRATYQQLQTGSGAGALLHTAMATEEAKCEVCSRVFKRTGDLKRHKCSSERQKPVCEQRGATQCTTCMKWFRSKGGLAVHRCQPTS